MYNRYIPQPDGSYQRNRIPEPEQKSPGRPAPPQNTSPPEPAPPEPSCPPPPVNRPGGQSRGNPGRQPRRPCPPPKQPPCQSPPPRQNTGVFQFFRQLLPGDFDTEDLLIVLLLLLMSGDCKEDRNTALLTLALYLFL